MQALPAATLCPNCQTTKPKAPKSAYLFYSSEQIPKLMDNSKGSLAVSEAAKQAGALWMKFDEEAKAKYNALHDADVLR